MVDGSTRAGQDLQRWRERFAEQLRANGVEANATPRRTRGATQRYPKQGVKHMLARGEVPMYWQAVANAEQRQAGWQSHDGVFAAWREIAQAMAASLGGDWIWYEMAWSALPSFVQAMPLRRDAPTVIDRPTAKRAFADAERLHPDRA